MQQLDRSGDIAAVAEQFALKSALTLLYWKHEGDCQQLQRAEDSDAIATANNRPKVVFQDEKGLLKWVLDRREAPLTRQDIVDHVLEEYPMFAASKTAAALKVWVIRFLKKYLPSKTLPVSKKKTDAVCDMDARASVSTNMIVVGIHQGVNVAPVPASSNLVSILVGVATPSRVRAS
ncbi:hypothetical protein P3T76_015181 [Phytophthora citrophthora]|uniref:Uncharacterized protein n=1 Tax=Phytophthora citrophthora TaxID=4793 RepID=A0AAD9G027_9STRA|nr:hypothetical protein P3T76_015108 [Phytophthora citrophthora]KAK1929408.1 hypothetical protein P3T76_015160 [Phytophthora citrophthora]KAK1929418.1 hypothetical protein P3T76_015170 [Phytophthora citrophthora]KAK1929429.1 hypothetical protein P3T76_015181 [Phytophthora citrophthora]